MKSLILGVLVLLACSLYAESVREPSLFVDTDFETVQDLIETHQIKHVADLLPLLPREFMSSYTLMYRSRGLQQASEANPRAIVFGRTAKFILTFNGDPAQKNFDTLEMMQFRDATKEFEFRRVIFKDGKAEISEANPRICLGCHGVQSHPIWSSYPKWPGAFNDVDEESVEGMAFYRFLAAQPAHPIYKYLVTHTEINKEWPLGWDAKHVHRPNNRLGRLLGGLTAQSAAQKLISSNFYRAYPNSVLFHLLRCDGADKAEFHAKIDGLFQDRYPEAKYHRLYVELATIADLREQTTYKLEKLILDSDRENWNLVVGFEPGGARYSADGFKKPSEHEQIEDKIAVRLMSHLVQSDAELRPFFQVWSVIEKFAHNESPGYGELFVAPYGIADAYQEVNLHARQGEMRKACGLVEQRLKNAP